MLGHLLDCSRASRTAAVCDRPPSVADRKRLETVQVCVLGRMGFRYIACVTRVMQ